MKRTEKKTGFTLVELLVVIGIIALLISILLPSLNKARETANRVKCASNLSQMGKALVLYANENKGAFPRTFADETTNAPSVATVAQTTSTTDPFATGIEPANNIPAAMFMLIRTEDLTPAVFVCPSGVAEADKMANLSAISRVNFTGDGASAGLAQNVSYSFVNVYPSSVAQKPPIKYKALITAFTSDFAVAADIAPNQPIATWTAITTTANRAAIVLGNSKNHNTDGQNVLYADGHAEFQQTPLCGSNSDNIYTVCSATAGAAATNGATAAVAPGDPKAQFDSVLCLNAGN